MLSDVFVCLQWHALKFSAVTSVTQFTSRLASRTFTYPSVKLTMQLQQMSLESRWSSACRSGLAAGPSGLAPLQQLRSKPGLQCFAARAFDRKGLISQSEARASNSAQAFCQLPLLLPTLATRAGGPGGLLEGRQLRQRTTRRGSRQVVRAVAGLDSFLAPAFQFQAWLTAAATNVESLPPAFYSLYMLATSFGVPLSEDALVVWVGANVFRGVYGAGLQAVAMIGYLFALVVLSDMVTFWLGRSLRSGAFSSLKQRFLPEGSPAVEKAATEIAKWSVWIGLVQRFTFGFPICLACGFLGVRTLRFAGGVAAGSFMTLGLQMGGAYLLRDKPGLCMTAIAVCNALELLPVVVAAVALGWQWCRRHFQAVSAAAASSGEVSAAAQGPASMSGSSSSTGGYSSNLLAVPAGALAGSCGGTVGSGTAALPARGLPTPQLGAVPHLVPAMASSTMQPVCGSMQGQQ